MQGCKSRFWGILILDSGADAELVDTMIGGGGGGGVTHQNQIVDGEARGRGGGDLSGYLRYDLFQIITEMGSRYQIVPIK